MAWMGDQLFASVDLVDKDAVSERGAQRSQRNESEGRAPWALGPGRRLPTSRAISRWLRLELTVNGWMGPAAGMLHEDALWASRTSGAENVARLFA